MKAITFINTNIQIDAWPKDLHITHPHGYAYRTSNYYIYLCGNGHPYTGLTVVEPNVQCDLKEWCKLNFGASDFSSSLYPVGSAIKSVWRPGISNTADLRLALSFTDEDVYKAGQALRILVEKLHEILLVVEPSSTQLDTYGHKPRDLLIAACTEVENYFRYYMQLANASPISGRHFTIRDYAQLHDKLFLSEYSIDVFPYPDVGIIKPFEDWTRNSNLLSWYDAYNKTKHHRDDQFAKSSLINCINAVAACLVLFSVRFGPTWWQPNFVNSPIPDAYRVFRQPPFSSDPLNVYVPKIQPPKHTDSKTWGDFTGCFAPWTIELFAL